MKILTVSFVIILSVLFFSQQCWAYNKSHGPFEEGKQPKSFDIQKLDSLKSADPDLIISVYGQRDKESAFRVHLMPCLGVSTVTYATIFDSRGYYVFGPVEVSRSCARSSVYEADLNKDNKNDYIVWVSSGMDGFGLSGYYYDIAFILSNERDYKCTIISTISPGMEDFVDLKGDGDCQFIHTSFEGVDKCKDGKSHNFWVYNILSFESDEVKINNSLHAEFPKTIWFTYKPNHKETGIITNEQKETIRKRSLEKIFIKDIDKLNNKTVQEQNLIQVKTIKHTGDFLILKFVEDKIYTARIANNDFDSIREDSDYIDILTSDFFFKEDLFRFILLDETGKTVVDYGFGSTYGNFMIDFVDLVGDNKKEIVFILGEGRGNSCRREILGVYEVVANSLKLLYSTQYSGWYGSHSRWWYDRCYRDIDGDGTTDLELKLDHNPIGMIPRMETPELIPKEKIKVFLHANGYISQSETGRPIPVPAMGTVAAGTREYTIKKGDSLWKIAENELGDGMRYKEILKLNPQLREDMQVGDKLKIPSNERETE